jgi:hypothetical protein
MLCRQDPRSGTPVLRGLSVFGKTMTGCKGRECCRSTVRYAELPSRLVSFPWRCVEACETLHVPEGPAGDDT